MNYNQNVKTVSKDKLRKELKAQRLALPVPQALEWSKAIINNCFDAINWDAVQSLHTFVPIARWREVDTWPLLQTIWSDYQHILTAVPSGSKLNAAAIGPTTQWQESKKGFPEPRGGTMLPADFQFDVILVPLLAFDRKGYRLGFGGG